MVNLQNPINGDGYENLLPQDTPRHIEDLYSSSSSACSTPFVSAPSSPGRDSPSAVANAVISGGCFYSAPASPMHYMLTSSSSGTCSPVEQYRVAASSLYEFEFEFSSRFSLKEDVFVGSMSSADELFLNGQIRPMKPSSHMEKPQIFAPLVDADPVDRGRDIKPRNRSLHRKTRSLSPFRSAAFQWSEEKHSIGYQKETIPENDETAPENETTPESTASSSRSSSSGRNSKKWIFLKEFLRRSKSEGRNNGKEKLGPSMVFSPFKEKKLSENADNAIEIENKQKAKQKQREKKETKKPRKSLGKKRRVTASAHELHYTANRAQAEEMKKRTYLPYRQGVLGCLGFSSKGYGALNGLARTLSPVSST